MAYGFQSMSSTHDGLTVVATPIDLHPSTCVCVTCRLGAFATSLSDLDPATLRSPLRCFCDCGCTDEGDPDFCEACYRLCLPALPF